MQAHFANCKVAPEVGMSYCGDSRYPFQLSRYSPFKSVPYRYGKLFGSSRVRLDPGNPYSHVVPPVLPEWLHPEACSDSGGVAKEFSKPST